MPNVDLEAIPGTVVLTDAEGIIEYVNRQFVEATGFDMAEMAGRPLLDVWEPVGEPVTSMTTILQHLAQAPVWRGVTTHQTTDGCSFREVSAISKLPADHSQGFGLLKVGQPLDPSQLEQPGSPATNQNDSQPMHDADRALLDHLPYGIAIIRLSDQRYLLCNRAFCDQTAYSRKEMVGKTPQALNLFHDPDDWLRMRRAVHRKEALDGLEVTLRSKDQRLAHTLLSVRSIHYSGAPCLLWVSQNVAETDTLIASLRESVENYRTIIEGAPVSIAITRLADSVYQEVNDSFCRRVRYGRDEILGRTAPELKFYTNLEDRERFLARFREQGYVDDLEIRFQDRYGQTLESLVSARRLKYKGEDCLLYISTRIDNLKAAQRALQEREENYRTILEMAPYNISITRLGDGTYVQVNRAFSLRTGYSAEEVKGRTPLDLNLYVNPSERSRLLEMLEKDGHVDGVEVSFRNKDGRIIESLISMSPMHIRGEDCIVSMTTDIGELKAAHRALEESEVRFRTIFETAADPIFLNDMQTGRFLDVNHAACRHLGYERADFLKMSLKDVDVCEDIDPLGHFLAHPAQTEGLFFESRHLLKNGTMAIVEVSSQEMRHRNRRVLLSLVRDITQRKQAENELARYRERLEQMVAERTTALEAAQRELVKQEKMALLGRLAATVSHELRNPLGVIRSSNFYLRRKIDCLDEKLEKHFQRIDTQISICDAIVVDLLEYTEGRRVSKGHQDFAAWLTSLVDDQRKKNALDVNLRIAPDLPAISYDPQKMQRVIVNLLNNAALAVGDRAARNDPDDPDYSPKVDIGADIEGDCLVISVRDNGIGMSPQTLSQAFEPLFSTRAQGVGIGLAIVKKIVEAHGGTITSQSRVGEGTRIAFSLPFERRREARR